MVTVFGKTVLIYLLLIAGMRFLGKRQLGQMEPSEVVVTMLVADLASYPMENPELSLWRGLFPIFVVLGLEILLSTLSLHSIKIRKLLCGKPVILIENGKFLQDNMRKTRVTLDELVSKLREKDVLDVSTVQYAILETGGNLSVFPYPEYRPAEAVDAGIPVQEQNLPITVISDGTVMAENLKKAGKDMKWLEKVLKEHKSTVKTTFLLTVNKQNQVLFFAKE